MRTASTCYDTATPMDSPSDVSLSVGKRLAGHCREFELRIDDLELTIIVIE